MTLWNAEPSIFTDSVLSGRAFTSVHTTVYADKTVSTCYLQVLVHWACQKISASLQQPDDELEDTLTGKLQKYRGIRYSLIAGHAESVGRKGLATLLLEYETCAADQVH